MKKQNIPECIFLLALFYFFSECNADFRSGRRGGNKRQRLTQKIERKKEERLGHTISSFQQSRHSILMTGKLPDQAASTSTCAMWIQQYSLTSFALIRFQSKFCLIGKHALLLTAFVCGYFVVIQCQTLTNALTGREKSPTLLFFYSIPLKFQQMATSFRTQSTVPLLKLDFTTRLLTTVDRYYCVQKIHMYVH